MGGPAAHGSWLVLTLFVADHTPASARARRQLDEWLERSAQPGIELTVVDVLDDPERAERERILATPALVRHHPPPRCKIVGDLSDWEQVLHYLEPPGGPL